MFVIVAIIFAVSCGLIAEKKNRNVWGWAILGFLFPLVAIIIILCLKRNIAWTVNPEREDLPCPYCRVKIGSSSIFCPKCGKQLAKDLGDQNEDLQGDEINK